MDLLCTLEHFWGMDWGLYGSNPLVGQSDYPGLLVYHWGFKLRYYCDSNACSRNDLVPYTACHLVIVYHGMATVVSDSYSDRWFDPATI